MKLRFAMLNTLSFYGRFQVNCGERPFYFKHSSSHCNVAVLFSEYEGKYTILYFHFKANLQQFLTTKREQTSYTRF